MKVWTDPNEFKCCSNWNVVFEKDIQVILLLGLLSASMVVIQRQTYDTFGPERLQELQLLLVFTMVKNKLLRSIFYKVGRGCFLTTINLKYLNSIFFWQVNIIQHVFSLQKVTKQLKWLLDLTLALSLFHTCSF